MSNSLFLAWRSGDSVRSRWGPVGRLDHVNNGYRFVYTRGAKTLEGFQPLPGMPDLDKVYESDEPFPFFANRLLDPSRPEYEAFLMWSEFDPDNPPDPIAILAVTEGRRVTDSFEVFPCPSPDSEGCYISKFFLHGIRWMPDAALERINRMGKGDVLGLMLDVCNSYDPDAVAVRTSDERNRFLVGYVPRFLARDVRGLCEACDPDLISVTVERVNRDAPFQQRVLCRMRSCWPDDFRPCSREEFQPLVSVTSQTV